MNVVKNHEIICCNIYADLFFLLLAICVTFSFRNTSDNFTLLTSSFWNTVIDYNWKLNDTFWNTTVWSDILLMVSQLKFNKLIIVRNNRFWNSNH